ncbi:MAG: methylated-DNA--[protein]-cysteine S-methyltransferase [Caldilineaceae bacterium]|nr:methylated-DNA--[protein]-cysteine S-methyltransferase [Caldilineaceae bacterium]
MPTDYERIAEAIRYLEQNFHAQPTLDDLAAHLHLSPFHLQRLFKRWAGISPKRFLQFLTIQYAKQLLDESNNVMATSFASGLSGPSRLHDLFVSVEAVTPGEFKTKGAGMQIRYGRHATPFGDCLLAATERGICALQFVDDGWTDALVDLQRRWQTARWVEAPDQTQPLIDQIFPVDSRSGAAKMRLLLQGTNFQIKVWEALLQIPAGGAATYADIAHQIGNPKAARAVGGAVGANEIAYLIPCHRVIRSSGVLDNYRWGTTRKKALFGWEAAHRSLEQAAAR